jgi:hypothetical protein
MLLQNFGDISKLRVFPIQISVTFVLSGDGGDCCSERHGSPFLNSACSLSAASLVTTCLKPVYRMLMMYANYSSFAVRCLNKLLAKRLSVTHSFSVFNFAIIRDCAPPPTTSRRRRPIMLCPKHLWPSIIITITRVDMPLSSCRFALNSETHRFCSEESSLQRYRWKHRDFSSVRLLIRSVTYLQGCFSLHYGGIIRSTGTFLPLSCLLKA